MDTLELWYDCHDKCHSQLLRPPSASCANDVSLSFTAVGVCSFGGKTISMHAAASGSEIEAGEVWHDCLPVGMDHKADLINATNFGTPSGPDADGDVWYDCFASNVSIALNRDGTTQRPPGSSHCFDPHKTLANDPFENRDRFVNMTDRILPDQLMDLLSKGPNFALSRSVNKNVLKDVEIGLERGAFALRLKEYIDKKD